MKITKVVRRTGDGKGYPVNAVIAASIGESGDASARSRQHVSIEQRDGRTEVHDHHSDDEE